MKRENKADTGKGLLSLALMCAVLAAAACSDNTVVANTVAAYTDGGTTDAPALQNGTEGAAETGQTAQHTASAVTSSAAAAADMPETEDGNYSFKAGVWLAVGDVWFGSGEGRNDCYYTFYADGHGGSITAQNNGFVSGFEYEMHGTEGNFSIGDAANVYDMSVSPEGEDVLIKWDKGRTEKLTYICPQEDFSFFSNEELEKMAKAYYAAKHDGSVPTKSGTGIEDDGLIMIQLYDDDSYSLNATSAWYFIDRYTGKGKDIDGRTIDLTTLPSPETWSPDVIQRQVMLDNDEFFGVRYLGYIDPSVNYFGDAVREILQKTGTAEDFPFVNEMPADKFVSTENGQELYLVIPFDESGSVFVYPQAAPDEPATDGVEPIYRSNDGEPFLLKCNVSEIYPDAKVFIADSSGDATEWYPSISGMDGRVLTGNNTGKNVHDFTDYDNLAGAYPASENTYGG